MAALSAEFGNPRRLANFHNESLQVFNAVNVALLRMEEGEPVTAKKGRRSKVQVAQITAVLGEIYGLLAGKSPTTASRPVTISDWATGSEAYGPFIDFLGSAYRVLGVRASATNQAKALVTGLRRQTELN
jgi:hypothetical protein